MQLGFGESQMLDKLLYDEEVRRCVLTYEQQFHYGVFYGYMKLREQVRFAHACIFRCLDLHFLLSLFLDIRESMCCPFWCCGFLCCSTDPLPTIVHSSGNPEHHVDL